MKNTFKKIAASVVAAASLVVGMTGIVSNAASVGSGKKTVANGVTLTGDIDLSWYSPAGGVNVYTVKATTKLSGASSSSSTWSLHTGIDLDNYSSGALLQSKVVNGGSKVSPVSASVSGAYAKINAKAFTSHEVRGAYSGVLYLSSSVMNI